MGETGEKAALDPTEWITTGRAAELTGYAPVTVRLLAREGKIQSLKIGRDWILNRESVLAYKARMEELGTAKHDPRGAGARETEEDNNGEG
jgi:excisionase family DNA binding protein